MNKGERFEEDRAFFRFGMLFGIFFSVLVIFACIIVFKANGG